MINAVIGLMSSVIVGVLSLVGVVYTNSQSNKKVENQLISAQAVTDVKLQNLTDEVKKHNEFGSRIPILENEVKQLKEEVKELKEK